MNFLRKTIDWEVKIPPNEVWKRIENAADPKTRIFFSTPKDYPEQSLFHTIAGNRLTIQKVQESNKRKNLHQPELEIEIKPTAFGSSLNGNLGSDLILIFHLLIFFFITSFFCVLGILFYKVSLFSQSEPKNYLLIAFPVFWSWFAFSFIKDFITRRRTGKMLTNFVKELFADVTVNRI